MRNQIIIEAEDYIQAFYEKRKLNVETSKVNNREREKVKNVEVILMQRSYFILWFLSS